MRELVDYYIFQTFFRVFDKIKINAHGFGIIAVRAPSALHLFYPKRFRRRAYDRFVFSDQSVHRRFKLGRLHFLDRGCEPLGFGVLVRVYHDHVGVQLGLRFGARVYPSDRRVLSPDFERSRLGG